VPRKKTARFGENAFIVSSCCGAKEVVTVTGEGKENRRKEKKNTLALGPGVKPSMQEGRGGGGGKERGGMWSRVSGFPEVKVTAKEGRGRTGKRTGQKENSSPRSGEERKMARREKKEAGLS